jgi:AI-2 transport protein TqsA
MWGLFCAFIGVPIALGTSVFCSQNPSSRWIADLLGGSKQPKTG